MKTTSIPYLSADLFCTLDEIIEEGGAKGVVAKILRKWLTPAGRLMFGEYHMLDIEMRGRAVQKDYEDE